CDVAYDTLKIVNHMLLTVTFNTERCLELAGANFATATDLADIMVRERKIPFRTAHKIVGRIVNEAVAEGVNPSEIDGAYVDNVAEELGFDKLNLDDELIHNALNPIENVKIRNVPGGPSPEMVQLAIDNMNIFLDVEFEKQGI
ncbi:MAG: argininosuccinate lyase, partial [Methanobrevibacter sp.]|nr:argininosuccinate lyase [Methanobrevibacter sp.]